ncbi:winged helix DNA-binding domain-containing protein [Isoptericola jiangsuensis]|uniref:winged helix DNA-binding domain-containing protein n=1 Tax=Isoptericola jiangsuensis TaxID=548579 RepID=UPI003AABE7DE
MSVDATTVRSARLRAQHLREPGLPDVTTAVGHLLAVQGQELRPTFWGLNRRLRPAARTGEAATLVPLDDGNVLRTHVLRPTWHLVLPDDARWLVELTAPRVERLMSTTEKSWGLGDPAAAIDAVVAEVEHGPRTRDQLAHTLTDQGVLAPDAPGILLTHVLMHAELQRLVVSGPRADGRHTYAPFDTRATPGYGPLGSVFDRATAVVELWRRYLPARAYAAVKDVAQWSGLTLTELRSGLAVLLDTGEAVEVPGSGQLDGLTLVTTPEVHDAAQASGATPPVPQAGAPSGSGADLLCAYDELLASYRETRGVLDDPRAPQPDRVGAFVHAVLVEDRLAARWRWPGRALPDGVGPELQWQREPSPADLAAVERAGTELSAYLAGTAG